MSAPLPFAAVLRDGDEPAQIRHTASNETVAYAVDDTLAEHLVAYLNGAELMADALREIRETASQTDALVRLVECIDRVLAAAGVA